MRKTNETVREKLLRFIDLYGEFPNRSIGLLADNSSTAITAVQRMKSSGVIRVKDTEYVKKTEYAKYQRIRKEKRKIKRILLPYHKKSDSESKRTYMTSPEWIERNHRVIECMTICSEAGYDIAQNLSTDNFTPLANCNCEAVTCKELKEFFNEDFNHATQYRSCGVALSPGGNYAMYNLNKSLIEWSKIGENKVKEMIRELLRIKKNYEEEINALLFVRDYTLAADIIKYTDAKTVNNAWLVKKNKNKNIFSLLDIYDNAYINIVKREGVYVHNMMSLPNWNAMLMQLLFTPEMMNNARNTPFDAYDTNTNTGYVEFISGNLVRMMNIFYFSKENPNVNLSIIALEHQNEMIMELLGESVHILNYDIKQIVEAMENYLNQ